MEILLVREFDAFEYNKASNRKLSATISIKFDNGIYWAANGSSNTRRPHNPPKAIKSRSLNYKRSSHREETLFHKIWTLPYCHLQSLHSFQFFRHAWLQTTSSTWQCNPPDKLLFGSSTFEIKSIDNFQLATPKSSKIRKLSVRKSKHQPASPNRYFERSNQLDANNTAQNILLSVFSASVFVIMIMNNFLWLIIIDNMLLYKISSVLVKNV